MKRPAAFIDRDGTISEEVGYINHPSRFRIFPYSAAAVRLLNDAGWLAILVTNQAGVARGYFTEDLIEVVHDRLRHDLEAGGARLDAVYYCPHHPSTGDAPYRLACECRKPQPGLIRQAARDFEIDLKRSWMIGDRYSDTELARNAGVRSAFVLSGYGRGEWEYGRAMWKHEPDLIRDDLLQVVQTIIGRAETKT
ncbi:MAG: HAD family hydrolase [Pyrinomonadaceae bacterium]|nr:HAD family hydrolase [Pyrinomonadaceae bacterium]